MAKRQALRVENDTCWSTRDLRKIFNKCLREVKKTEKHHSLNRLVVRVINHKADWVGGRAWFDSGAMVIKIPHPRKGVQDKEKIWQSSGLDFAQSIAYVFIHELGHCIGIRPGGKVHRKYMTIEGPYMDWIRETFSNEKTPVKFKIPVPKAKPGDAEKYASAIKNLKKANTRLKRAVTIQKKWDKKVKYYEKKMAAKEKDNG